MTKTRCHWVPTDDELYVSYHDEEWGVPIYDSRALFEKLILDGFQAGLSWRTILYKRENFIAALDGFNPEKIARYDDHKIAELMANAGIIRSQSKIKATISNAQAFLKLQENADFSKFLWDFVDGQPIVNSFKSNADIPAKTEISEQLSKALKQRHFKFCGPVIVYAFMQAVGMVNDHLVDCFRFNECQKTT